MVFVGFAVANDVLATRLAAGLRRSRTRIPHRVDLADYALRRVRLRRHRSTCQRPEIHKRLMLLATVSMIPPAIARLFFAVSVGIGPGLRPGLGPPRTVESVLMPGLIADALILAGVIYDMRTRGRPHPAYLIGGAIVLAVQVLRIPAEHDAMVVRDRGLPRAVQRLSLGFPKSPVSKRDCVARRTGLVSGTISAADHPCGLIGAGHLSCAFALAMTSTLHLR